MGKKLLLFGGLIGLLIAGVVGYAFFKTPEEASGPIESIPLAQSTKAATSAPTSAPTSAATAAPEATATTEPTEAPAAQGEPILFEIAQEQSQARFIINETLQGAPVQVVGITDQVAGQIAVNPTDVAATAQVGVIQVNARTLTTDNDFRNRAIKNRILLTDQHEFVTFTPKELIGLPASGAVGEPYSFQILGDLSVAGTTREVTFDVTLTADSETQLKGLASTTILYKDFNLAIPDAPAVDEVEDTVRLELEFVAQAPQS